MIIITGIAGSGKTTQGQILANRLGCPWFSTGQMLRDNMHDPKVVKQMLEGEVIDDSVLLPLLKKEFKKLGADKNEFILDGSPRTLYQARWLADLAEKQEIFITAVIHLKASKDVVRQRLLARGRPDDKESAIAERFSEYDKAILPILGYLGQKGYKVLEINGNEPIKDDAVAIEQALGE